MYRRYYSTIAMVAVAVVAVAVLVAAQKAIAPGKKTTAAQGSARATAGRGKSAARPAPIRPADPNRAPQSAVDDALYTNQEFFGVSASVARPYSFALERVD